MITAQIRRCRRLIPQVGGVVLSHDNDQGTKPGVIGSILTVVRS